MWPAVDESPVTVCPVQTTDFAEDVWRQDQWRTVGVRCRTPDEASALIRAKKPEAFHPFSAALWPIVDGFAILTHAKSVSSLGANVEFSREILLLVLEVQHGSFH